MKALLQAYSPTLREASLIDYVERLLAAFSAEPVEVPAIELPEGLSAESLKSCAFCRWTCRHGDCGPACRLRPYGALARQAAFTPDLRCTAVTPPSPAPGN